MRQHLGLTLNQDQLINPLVSLVKWLGMEGGGGSYYFYNLGEGYKEKVYEDQ